MSATRTAAAPSSLARLRSLGLGRYFVVGTAFGVVITRSEVISWFRIQEMFRFQSFHMYGVLASAILVAAISTALLRRFGTRSLDGRPIALQPHPVTGWGTRYWGGGAVFGLGWALTGACPGPLFALTGAGVSVMLVAILAAVAGTYVYGVFRSRLPH